MKQYRDLLKIILEEGYHCEPAQRQDVGTIQINSYEFKHDLHNGFPLLTTKELSFNNIAAELLWFLNGDTNIKYLVDRGCNIWNSDAYKFYLRKMKELDESFHNQQRWHPMPQKEFIDAIKDDNIISSIPNYNLGDLGPVYGKQWRRRITSWFTKEKDSYKPVYVDQIANIIKDIKQAVATGNNNRRLIVDAWNPSETHLMALPPCHYGFQVILEPMSHSDRLMISDGYVLGGIATHEDLDKLGIPKYYLNLAWNQRSVDTFLGLPYNIASYSLLAHILAKVTNTLPKEIIGSLKAVHLYDNHIEQVHEQLSRLERGLPFVMLANDVDWEEIGNTADFTNVGIHDMWINDYDPHPSIKAQIVT